MSNQVYSMTGFAAVEGATGSTRTRIEIKALNHRFLDVKLRLPRDLAGVEIPFRAALQGRFSRGAVEVSVSRLDAGSAGAAAPAISVNLELAKHYHDCLRALQDHLSLKDEIRARDIASYPKVLLDTEASHASEELWAELEPLAKAAMAKLAEMRALEGANLVRALLATIEELEATLVKLRARRAACEESYRARLHSRIKNVFDAYPIAEAQVQSVLESRLAQELALLIERTDIEEELTRFKGHLDHFRKILSAGGPVGRKLDFVLQELNREINTLGNKAQDFQMSEEVVAVKVRVEQLREQVMNLE